MIRKARCDTSTGAVLSYGHGRLPDDPPTVIEVEVAELPNPDLAKLRLRPDRKGIELKPQAERDAIDQASAQKRAETNQAAERVRDPGRTGRSLEERVGDLEKAVAGLLGG